MNRPLDGRTIAVTGAAGFIGSHLVVELASRGADVVAIDHDAGWRPHLGEQIQRGDVRFVPTSRRWPYGGCLPAGAWDGVDTVVHLAYTEPTSGNEAHAVRAEVNANLLGTLELVESLPASVATFGFASTTLVYGRGRQGRLAEDLPPQPDSAYALAKVGVEQALADFGDSASGRSAVVFRFSTIYGRTETVPRAIPNFIRRLLSGVAPQVAVGADQRDYIHVTDACSTVAAALSASLDPFEVLNVGTGVGVRTDDLARLVAEVSQLGIDPDIGQARRSPVELVSDPTRANQRVGACPKVDLATGLADEIEWFRTRPDLLTRPC